MRNFLKKLLSLTLVIIMIASMATVGITSASALSTGSAVLDVIGGRCFKEFTSYCISTDVPVLGKAFYYVLCDPSQRSAIQNTAKINAILQTVKGIDQDLDKIMTELDVIYKAVQQGFSDIYYKDMLDKVNSYAIDDSTESGYQTLWTMYSDFLATADEADQLYKNGDAQKAKERNDVAMELYEAFINEYEKVFDTKTYVSTYYTKDMNNINDLICKKNKDDLTQFLPALEKMLRLEYNFEHQITPYMYSAFEYCEMIQTQMYLIHKEYASYSYAKQQATPDEAELPEDFFSAETKLFEENLQAQITNSGLDTFMTTEDVSDVEGYNLPYEFDTTISINGEEVPCYIFRDNGDLCYYAVTKEIEKPSQLVSHREERWDNVTDVNYYQPFGMLNSRYTDDGEFRMISSLSEVTSLAANPVNDYINSGIDVSQHATHILLYNYDCAGINKDDVVWNMKFASSSDYDKNNPENNVSTFSSKDVYNGSADNVKLIRIYKNVCNDNLFKNDNTLKVKTADSMPKMITLHNGQTLDYSYVETPIEGCTILLSGEATIIGNPNAVLKNSQIIVCTDEQITLQDVNVNAIEYKSAIDVRCADAKIKFAGNNTFTGNGSAADLDKMVELDTNNHNPVGVSHGMLINENASVTLTGATATFNGDGGGAGICTWGNLVVDNATIIANGSYEKLDSYFGLYEEFKAPVYSVGAGIGASVSAVKNSKNSTVYLKEDLILGRTYDKYGTITIKNNSDITAKGAYPDGDKSGSYASDIGGAQFVTHIDGEDVLGWIVTDLTYTYNSKSVGGGNISDSVLNLYKGNIGGNITQSNNSYDYSMDTYTITTCTAGSSGVTDDKLSFVLYGNKGSTNGTIKSGKCGNEKGEYTFTCNMGYIGTELTAIEIEIEGDDGWYPEYINVKSENGKINRTLYGGRWLDNNETITLKATDNVFKVDIKTANVDNAGTDADVYVQLVDENGETTAKINASDVHPKSNAFEKGDNMSLYIYAPQKFGKLEYININSDANDTAAANWKIESLGATKMSGNNDVGDSFSITVNQWDPNGVTMSFGRETGKSGTFEFDIKTQNKTGAGTDATIKFRLIGTNGETDLVNVEPFIDSYTSGDNFEKNANDKGRITFKMPAGGIGKIEAIYVESSGGAASADWDLEYIDVTEIVPGGTGQHVRFNKECTIKKNSNKTLTECDIISSAVVTSSVNRQLLEKLQMVDENSYLLSVNESVTISADALKYLKDNGITLTIEMKDGTGILYSVTFVGEKITSVNDLTLGKDYEIRDKEALVGFLTNSNIPEGTTLKLYLSKLGFTEDDVVSVYLKDENGNWTKDETQLPKGEIYQELEIEDGKDILLKAEGSCTDENTTVDKDVVSTGNNCTVVFTVLSFSVMGCFTLIGFGLSIKKKEQ